MAKEIPLTKGHIAIVDDEDYEWLTQWNWCFDGRRYAIRGIKGNGTATTVLMHRQIMEATKGKQVDHINRNGLDNRRDNLRLASQSQNLANSISRRGSSQYKGVSWNRKRACWVTCIRIHGRTIYLGSFGDEIEAARIYDKAAQQLFGEFARTNFLTNKETIQ